MWREALHRLDARTSSCGRRLLATPLGSRLTRWATAKLNLLAPDVRSQILIIVQADGNVSVAYDHPKSGEDVVALIQAIGTSLQIVANRHQVPLAIQQPNGQQIPLNGPGFPVSR